MRGVRGQHLTPGELRQTQNWIGPAGSTIATATFVPPPPHEVPSLLGDVETFLHGDGSIPLLVKIGLALAQFLQGVAEVSVEAANTARMILVLREDHRRQITDRLGRVAGKDIACWRDCMSGP